MNKEKSMAFCIACIIIGCMILGAGIYYLIQEKDNAESRKVYGITSLIGAVILLVAVFLLICQVIY